MFAHCAAESSRRGGCTSISRQSTGKRVKKSLSRSKASTLIGARNLELASAAGNPSGASCE